MVLHAANEKTGAIENDIKPGEKLKTQMNSVLGKNNSKNYQLWEKI